MTDERIAEIRRLCEAATPGPWGVFQTTPFEPVVVNSPTGDVCTCDEYEHRPDEREPDAHFIAAARTAVPELLAECERLRAEVQDVHNAWTADLNKRVAPWAARLPAIRRKLGYLLRDYPSDKETAGIIAAIDSALSASGETQGGR